jgi:hypothetical protein
LPCAASKIRLLHASLSIDPNTTPPVRWSDLDFRMARARIVTHYFYHRAALADNLLPNNVTLLNGMPGILIQDIRRVIRAWAKRSSQRQGVSRNARALSAKFLYFVPKCYLTPSL